MCRLSGAGSGAASPVRVIFQCGVKGADAPNGCPGGLEHGGMGVILAEGLGAPAVNEPKALRGRQACC